MVNQKMYVPRCGDVVWLDFNPQSGHEQAGRRPAVVLTDESYNEKAGLSLFCPITNQSKGYPFEVSLPEGFSVTGVILADQVKSFDWKARKTSFAEALPSETIQEVLAKVKALLGFS